MNIKILRINPLIIKRKIDKLLLKVLKNELIFNITKRLENM
jgi:hypothetical protein